jgi:tetratricopeptide (TPR) repeat protein
MQTGRDISPARALLHDAIPLAKNDDQLLGRILVAITGVRSGADVELAAKRVWVLMRRQPDLEQFRGRVLYNLAYSHAKRFQLVKAARYYRQAASLLQGRHQGWAYHNLAEICIELGRYRAAQAAAGKATPLLSPEDRHMHAGVLAYLAVATGHVERALGLIQSALADSECPPLTRAYLWYYEALAYRHMEAYDQVCELLDRIWACATEVQFLRLCDRVARLQAEVNLRKGVS